MATRRATRTTTTRKPSPRKPSPKKRSPQTRTKASTMAAPEPVVVHDPNAPDWEGRVEATRYEAMRKALLRVLPSHAPGLTQAQMLARVVPHLPTRLFPGGAKAGWWAKTVQLDLEARGLVVRDAAQKPTRWRKTWPSHGRPRGTRY